MHLWRSIQVHIIIKTGVEVSMVFNTWHVAICSPKVESPTHAWVNKIHGVKHIMLALVHVIIPVLLLCCLLYMHLVLSRLMATITVCQLIGSLLI